jgi:hypothetical protein
VYTPSGYADDMLSEQTRVGTDRAGRYLAQLCEHLHQLTARPGMHGPAGRHDGGPPDPRRVEWTADRGVIVFERATFTLTAAAHELTLRVEAEEAQDLERIKHALSERIEAIGRRDGLTVTW